MTHDDLDIDQNDKLFHAAILELVSFVRAHPHSKVCEHLRPILCSLAFDIPVTINVAAAARQLDAERLSQVITAIRLRPFRTWPVDVIDDDELAEWHKADAA